MKKQIFYIESFSYLHSNAEPDVSDVPALIRRKLSSVDKAGISVMLKVFREDIEEIVFSSDKGEFSRLNTIISQYLEMNEVSPAQFSASVHNYIPGFFTLMKKLNIPYSALSAGENSISAGLIKSIISKNNRVMFTYTDEASVSAIITKNGPGIKCVFTDTKEEIENNEFERFVDFLEGKVQIFKTPLGTFERISE